VIWSRERRKAGRARGGGHRRLPAISVAALALAVAAAVGGTATAARDSGQPTAKTSALPSAKKAMWGPLSHNGLSLFPTYRDLRVGIYQTQLHWDQIAPTKPTNPTDPNDPAYQWPSYVDTALSEAAGMKLQLMIIGTPPWANGGRDRIWPPNQPSDFGDFATAAAKKYPSVNLWMIWGEPNRKPNFGPLVPVTRFKGPLTPAQQVAPRIYSQLLDAAYGALKAVSSANLVIGGNTYTAAGRDDVNTYQWIQNLRLPSGARPRMDLYGHNPYGFTKPNLKSKPSPRGTVTFSDVRRLARALDKARFPGPPIRLFLSEWGVPIGFKDKDLQYRLKVKEALQWIRAACKISRWGRIYALGWVHPVDTERSSQGLLTGSLKQKPSYKVWKKC
jgi:hypothetical protein